MTHKRTFPCRPESVSAARKFVRETLAGGAQEFIEAIELMTSELTTNCVRHANTDFELVVEGGRSTRVEVRDCGAGEPRRLSPTPHDPSGRGLRIVDALSDSWGVAPSSGGKTVWFSLSEQGPRGTGSSDRAGGPPHMARC